jgi:hypothetical protein
MSEDRATKLSQTVEKEVRFLIGDLHMQILVLRSMLDMVQQQQQQQPQQDTHSPQSAASMNGGRQPEQSQ